MKRHGLFLLIGLLVVFPVFSQNLNIPDTAFFNALIDLDVDTNDDGLISPGEAEAVSFLDISDRAISHLAGIESFVNLDSLNCRANQITYLDLSANIAIESLRCDHNQITSLFVFNNHSLVILDCGANQLKNLDLSNNKALLEISLSEMPTLQEVCVWTMPFPPESIILDTTLSPNVYFRDCASTGMEKNNESALTIFPNPTTGWLTIISDVPQGLFVTIYTSNGQMVHYTTLIEPLQTINMSSFQKGIYFITIRSKDSITTRRIVKL